MDHHVIAETCHEANRVLQAANGDPVSRPWAELDEETRLSALDGVLNALDGATPEESHRNWLSFKYSHGWAYGAAKDEVAKAHPCMVAYEDLPDEQRAKDRLFTAIVRALADQGPVHPALQEVPD